MEKTGKILIVDGHGLAFRAFYAVPPLSAPDGTPTNAITGFMNMLARVEEDLSPGCCAVVFRTLPFPEAARSFSSASIQARSGHPNCRRGRLGITTELFMYLKAIPLCTQ